MQKFIISKEGELILGNVEFHFELLGKITLQDVGEEVFGELIKNLKL